MKLATNLNAKAISMCCFSTGRELTKWQPYWSVFLIGCLLN